MKTIFINKQFIKRPVFVQVGKVLVCYCQFAYWGDPKAIKMRIEQIKRDKS